VAKAGITNFHLSKLRLGTPASTSKRSENVMATAPKPVAKAGITNFHLSKLRLGTPASTSKPPK